MKHITAAFTWLFAKLAAPFLADKNTPQPRADQIDDGQFPEVPENRTRTSHALGLVALALMLSAAVGVGCKATPQTIAYRTVASVQAGVHEALALWNAHVEAKQNSIALLADSGERTVQLTDLLAKQNDVHKALVAYQNAALIGQVGVHSALAGGQVPASEELVAAAQALTVLVQTLTH